MSKVEIKISSNHFLKEESIGGYVKDVARNIANRCGEGYGSKVELRETRYVSTVFAETKEAVFDNRRNKTILKNLRG